MPYGAIDTDFVAVFAHAPGQFPQTVRWILPPVDAGIFQ